MKNLVLFLLTALVLAGRVVAAPVVSEGSGSAPMAMAAATDNQRLQRNMLELLSRLDQIEQEMRQMRGDVEVLTNELSGIKRRQRELYLDMDRRLREVELGAVRAIVIPPQGGAPARPPAATGGKSLKQPHQTAKVGKPAKAAAPGKKEKIAYRKAFNLLKEGRYAQSISAFEKFMKAYPNSSYADNAQYWLGEANYVSRKYQSALREFKRVIEGYPDSPKIGDAMLKLGFTYYELKQYDKSRKTLEKVVKRFPKSTVSRLAQTRLNRMKTAGKK